MLPEPSVYFVKASTARKMNLFPCSLLGNGPVRSTHNVFFFWGGGLITMYTPKRFGLCCDWFQWGRLTGPYTRIFVRAMNAFATLVSDPFLTPIHPKARVEFLPSLVNSCVSMNFFPHLSITRVLVGNE